MLKLEKRITLHTFDVEYIDQREPKPRAVHHELCVLDGGRVSALERLGQSPASWICQQYARQGFTVGAVHKSERLTANVDTVTLWGMAVQQAGTQHKSAAPDPAAGDQHQTQLCDPDRDAYQQEAGCFRPWPPG